MTSVTGKGVKGEIDGQEVALCNRALLDDLKIDPGELAAKIGRHIHAAVSSVHAVHMHLAGMSASITLVQLIMPYSPKYRFGKPREMIEGCFWCLFWCLLLESTRARGGNQRD